MNTVEHIRVGDAIRLALRDNPYISQEDDKTWITLMCHKGDVPEPLPHLRLTLGEVVAMPDYATDKDWNMKLNLSPCNRYNSTEELGEKLLKKEVSELEKRALLGAIHDLANPKRKRSSIDTAIKIAKATYFPVKSVSNLIRQLMFLLRVKHYDKKLGTNQTHFTPWSIRVYAIGHTMALEYAEASYHLKQRAIDPSHRSDNPYFLEVIDKLGVASEITAESLTDYAHRYHAMSIETEMYTAHYLSDHFAAGHMSLVGDLRVEMPKRYGVLGGVAVNTMHNELNRISVKSKKAYCDTHDPTAPPMDSYGDGDFDDCDNAFNRQACIEAIQHSVNDIEQVLEGKERPEPCSFGAKDYLRDIDENMRQPQPMFLMHDDHIYVRGNLHRFKRIGPDDYERLQQDPRAFGYTKIQNRLHLLGILVKLRVIPFYKTDLKSLNQAEQDAIKAQEEVRNPDRDPMPVPPCALKIIPEPGTQAYFERGGSPYLDRSRHSFSEEGESVQPENAQVVL